MQITELTKICLGRDHCEGCPAKKECNAFKKMIADITEPWEMEKIKSEDFQ